MLGSAPVGAVLSFRSYTGRRWPESIVRARAEVETGRARGS